MAKMIMTEAGKAWTEGRLWWVASVMEDPAILDHAAGCPDCTWDRDVVTLCTPSLELIEAWEADRAAEARSTERMQALAAHIAGLMQEDEEGA